MNKEEKDQEALTEGTAGWTDGHRDAEQLDLLHTAVTSTCEMGAEKVGYFSPWKVVYNYKLSIKMSTISTVILMIDHVSFCRG